MKSKQQKQTEALARRYKDRATYERKYDKAMEGYGETMEGADHKLRGKLATQLFRAQFDIKQLCKKLNKDAPVFTYFNEELD